MRLLLVISSLGAGGAERVLGRLAGHWAERGWQVDLVTTHDAGQPPHHPLSPAVRLRSVDPRCRSPRRQAATLAALRAIARESRPDAIVSFLNFTNVTVLLAARGLGAPVVVSERIDPRAADFGGVWPLLRRLTYPSAALLVAQTSTAAAWFERLLPGRVRVIPNPVPAAEPLPAGGRIAFPSPTILAVGRLHPQKGFDLAIRALALLPPAYAAWQLVILGEGPERARLEALAARLGLADRVRLPGRVADVRPYQAGADLFLLSSRYEGFPNALTEAMAAGLPVVAADCPSGPADIVRHRRDGLLVPPDDPRALAAGLQELIDSPALARSLAAGARAVLERFAEASVFAAWDRVLLEAAGRPATEERSARP